MPTKRVFTPLAPPDPPRPHPVHQPQNLEEWLRASGHSQTELMVAGVLALSVASFFLAVFLLQVAEARARRKVEAWAKESNYHLIKKGVVKATRGPFKGRPAWQTICVFTVRVPQGWNKSGWICFNNFLAWGFGKPEIHWDEEAGKLAV